MKYLLYIIITALTIIIIIASIFVWKWISDIKEYFKLMDDEEGRQ